MVAMGQQRRQLATRLPLYASSSSSRASSSLFSLQSLLDLARQANQGGTEASSQHGAGRFLLECVAHRLATQERRLKDWTRRLETATPQQQTQTQETHQEETTATTTPTTSRTSTRVIQTSRYHVPLWKQQQQQQQQLLSSSNNMETNWQTRGLPAAQKRLATLHWIHQDTHKVCHGILQLSPAAQQPYLQSTMTQVQARHARSVETLAELVVQDLRPYHRVHVVEIPAFLRDRLGIQLLCEHYMEISKGKPHGTIDHERPLVDALLDAMGEANILAQAYFDHVPDMILLPDQNDDSGCSTASDSLLSSQTSSQTSSSSSIQATFVGPWLHYILVEILKNALTATVQEYPQCHGENLPPVTLHCRQDDDMTWITVQDVGPGLGKSTTTTTATRHVVMDSFDFAQTDKIWDRLSEQTTYAMVRSPLQGLGVGLSLSATMMEYFGGTLRLESSSLSGRKGTRACLGIPRDLTLLEVSSLSALSSNEYKNVKE